MATTRNTLSGGCLTVFGLPFFAVGVVMFGLVGRTLNQAKRMESWTAVPATILAAELESHRDSDGDVTHRVSARYRYVVAGQAYEGERVGLHSGSDNIGSYHQDWHRKLQAALQSGATVPGYVNPSDPSQAVLDRTPRTGMLLFEGLFGLVFGGAGLTMIVIGLCSGRGRRALRQARAQYPEAPWRWRTDWAAAQVNPSSGAGAWGLLAMAIFWNAISWPMAVYVLPRLWQEKSMAGFFLPLFPLLGLALAAAAVAGIRSWRRFRNARLHLKSVPVPPGGELVAGLRLPERLQPREGLHLTLRCLRTEIHGAGKHRRVVEVPLWEAKQSVAQQTSRDPTSSLWPVHFVLPADRPPADAEPLRNPITWRLEARAKVDGPDLNLAFELPVFGSAGAAGPMDALPP